MTGALISITLRALLNRRRTVLLALLGGLLVLIALLLRLAQPGAGDPELTRGLLSDFGLAVLLPLVAVIVGTSVLGAELDDGTIVYLLAKPIPRRLIVGVKVVVAWLVTSLLAVPAIIVAGLIGDGDAGMAAGFGVAAVVGGLEYTAIFVALSLVTSRALIIGLAYVVVWEGVVAGIFEGTRAISVRQHALAVADAVGGAAGDSSELAIGFAMAAGLVTIGSLAFAIHRLERVELKGET